MKIKVGFSRPQKFNIVSWLIRLYQGMSEFSHTYLQFNMDKIDRDVVYEASHGDVHFEELTNWSKRNKIVDEFTLEITDEHKLDLMRFCIDNSNKPYGFLTLIGILLKAKIGKDDNQSFICSELVSKALKLDGANDFLTPQEVHDILEKRKNG